MKKIILLFMILLLIPLAYSIQDSNYSQLGYLESDFSSGEGEFNEGVEEVYKTATLNAGVKYPIVVDMDGDGIKEIFALDGTTAKIYNYDGSTLSLINSLVTSLSSRISNIIAYNIDGDDFTEIIIADEFNNKIHIYEYNGTSFKNISDIDISEIELRELNGQDGDTMIACKGINNCLLVSSSSDDNSNPNSPALEVVGFDSSELSGINTSTGGYLRIDVGGTFETYCFPKIETITLTDYDTDGTEEFIFSSVRMGGITDKVIISFIDLLENNTPILDQPNIITTEIIDDTSSALIKCSTKDTGKLFTSPLVSDFVTGGSQEVAIGINTKLDEYKLFLYDGIGCNDDDSCLNDDYPEGFSEPKGEMLGNLILADVFSDSGKTDFCVFSHHDEDETLSLFCGSENTFEPLGFFNSMIFSYDTSGQYNLSQDYDDYSIVGHSGQHKTQSLAVGFGSQDETNPDEFITSYGVFEVSMDLSNTSQLWARNLNRIFKNTRLESALVPVDYDDLNANDLIGLQSTKVFIIDDGLTEAPATITYWEFNPCPINTILKLNGTMDISVIVTDGNPELIGANPVSARITIYEGDVNSQNQTLINFTSGGEFQATNFQLNKSITNGNIKLEAWDTSHPTTIDTIDISFSVATNGLEFNDVKCSEDLSAVSEEEAEKLSEEAQDIADLENTIESSFDTLGVPFITSQIFWIILMIIIAIVIWTAEESFIKSPQMAFGLILLVEVLMLILGTLFGFIGAGILISVVVIGLIAIAMWLRKIFSSSI